MIEMEISPELKMSLHTECYQQTKNKLDLLQEQVAQLKEAGQGESKSSMGDKYETGRAMAQLELDKIMLQLHQVNQQLKVLSELQPKKKCTRIEHGTLVKTSQGYFYLATGLGMVKYLDQSFFVISAGSPLGKALIDQQSGATVQLNGRSILIQSYL